MRDTFAQASFLIVGLLYAQAADNLIRCHEQPLDRNYWAWREIDGRKCWFRGPRDTPKLMLFWDDRSRAAHDDGRDRGRDLVPIVVPADVGEFDQRWNELMIDLGVAPWTPNSK